MRGQGEGGARGAWMWCTGGLGCGTARQAPQTPAWDCLACCPSPPHTYWKRFSCLCARPSTRPPAPPAPSCPLLQVASFKDKDGNDIEMGLHVFFGCYFNLFRLMAKCGVLENLLLKEHTHTFVNTVRWPSGGGGAVLGAGRCSAGTVGGASAAGGGVGRGARCGGAGGGMLAPAWRGAHVLSHAVARCCCCCCCCSLMLLQGGDVRDLDFRFYLGDTKIGAPFHGLRAFFTTPQVDTGLRLAALGCGGWAGGVVGGCLGGGAWRTRASLSPTLPHRTALTPPPPAPRSPPPPPPPTTRTPPPHLTAAGRLGQGGQLAGAGHLAGGALAV